MLLVPLPWTARVWALLFLTCWWPSQRYDWQRSRAHRKLTDRARQMGLLGALAGCPDAPWWSPPGRSSAARACGITPACLRSEQLFQMSKTEADMIKVPRALYERLTETLCYAA